MGILESFQLLKVTQDSTIKEVREAYWGMALTNHPDHGGDTQRFQELVDAYREVIHFAENAPCAHCKDGYTITIDRNFHTLTVPCAFCMGSGLRG